MKNLIMTILSLIGMAVSMQAQTLSGKLVDENIIRIYQCPNGHEWRAA